MGEKHFLQPFIIGFLSGAVFLFVGIYISTLFDSVDGDIQSVSDKETTFINKDELFVVEYEKYDISYVQNKSALVEASSSLNILTQESSTLLSLVKEIKDLTLKGIENHSGDENRWFESANKCYTKREELYSIYSKEFENERAYLSGLDLLLNSDDIEIEVNNLLSKASASAKTDDFDGLANHFNNIASKARSIRAYISKANEILNFESLRTYIKWTNQLEDIAKQAILLSEAGKGATDSQINTFIQKAYSAEATKNLALANIKSEIGGWYAINVTKLINDAKTIRTEANQICNEASVIYSELYPEI